MQQLDRAEAEDTVVDILKRILLTGDKEKCVMVGLFCWSLWTRRNKWIWDRVNMSIFGVKVMAFNMLADWRRGGEKRVTTPHQLQAAVRCGLNHQLDG